MQDFSIKYNHKVIKSVALDKWEQKQFRFPKSKKKRIRQKWAKKGYNFRGVFAQNKDIVVNKMTGDIFLSSALYDFYMSEIKKRV